MNHSKPTTAEGELSADKLRRFVEAFFDAVENGAYEQNASELNAIAANLDRSSTDITSPNQDDPHHELD
jgi:hypothetical protein